MIVGQAEPDNRRMVRFTFIAGVSLGLAACSPSLDWREFVPEGSGISVTFPCRPDRQARAVMLAGDRVSMEMLSCSADGATFALAFADVADPAKVGGALDSLEHAAVANVEGTAPRAVTFALRGMTPNDHTIRLDVDGHFPDGTVVHEHAAFFSHGLRLYQASVIGAKPAPEAVETFLAGLKFAE